MSQARRAPDRHIRRGFDALITFVGPSISLVALVHGAGWAESWQRSWDRVEETFMPDREFRISALLDVVDVLACPTPRA
jgi:hypothetical protein